MQKMDTERSHHSNSSCPNDLFICFKSCFSSSSSIPSKSLCSPGPTKDSLTSSLSRRLKTSGSLKGGQASSMFPLFTKKRSSSLENPEPSSPKVTCIGQVRVKTKKQGKKLRLISQKRNNTTTLRSHSLRSHRTQKQECLPHRNQNLVHLPMTICDAVRALGSCCVSPVSSSCGVTSSSPACCARWFVCLHEDDGKERAIEFVVGDEEEFERTKRKGHRNHVFEDIEIDESNFVQVHEQCVPPKNALLLMRFRSDPLKMSALVNRFCESPLREYDDEDEVVYEKCVFSEADEKQEIQIVQANSIPVSEQERAEIDEENQDIEDTRLSSSCAEVVESQDPERQEEDAHDNEETGPSLCSSFLASLLHSESEEENQAEEQSAEDVHERSESEQDMHIDNLGEQEKHQEEESQMLPECLLLMMYEPKLSMEVSKETWVCSTDFIRVLPRKHVNNKKSDIKDEPKSPPGHGEMSKQVVNCVQDESKKVICSTYSCKQQLQPRRSSCHYPSAAAAGIGSGGSSMAAMIEQKTGKSIKGSEPLGLTRCKSEPMRSSAKFAPAQDACFRENGKVGETVGAGISAESEFS